MEDSVTPAVGEQRRGHPQPPRKVRWSERSDKTHKTKRVKVEYN